MLSLYPKMDKKLKKAWEMAESFAGTEPPNAAVKIGRIKSSQVPELEFTFYQDDLGNYYYQSNRQEVFEKEMKQAIKKNKKRR